MIELLQQVFTPDKFNIKTTDFLHAPTEYEISNKTDVEPKTIHGNHCLTISVNKDFIYLAQLLKCGMNNGNSLLDKLDEFARLINLHKIQLMDDSNIFICGIKIKLSYLYILTNGESWYNAHGYYSSDDESETDNNKTILIKDIDDYVKECIDLKCTKYDNDLKNMKIFEKNAIIFMYKDKSYKKDENFIERYHNIKSYETDPVGTIENIKTQLESYLPQIKAKYREYFKNPKYLVHDFFKVIKEILKTSNCDTDKNELIIISKFINLCSMQIQYDGDELTKDLSEKGKEKGEEEGEEKEKGEEKGGRKRKTQRKKKTKGKRKTRGKGKRK